MVPGDRTQTQDHTLRQLGFDSLTNYQWCHYVRPQGPYEQWGETALAAWERWAGEFSIPFYPHVSIGWDTNPRFKEALQDLVTGSTPERFGAFLRRAMRFVEAGKLSPRLITVNSWNEWSESSYLEPDTVYGMQYLEAVREALKQGATLKKPAAHTGPPASCAARSAPVEDLFSQILQPEGGLVGPARRLLGHPGVHHLAHHRRMIAVFEDLHHLALDEGRGVFEQGGAG